MCRLIPLLALALALPLAAAPVPKGIKARPQNPEGVWYLVAVQPDGKEGSVENMERFWIVRGESVTLGRPHADPGRPQPPVCKLTTPDPTRPHLRRFGDEQNPSVLEVDGDALRFCYTHDGRKELSDCKPGPGVFYYEFKRVAEPPK